MSGSYKDFNLLTGASASYLNSLNLSTQTTTARDLVIGNNNLFVIQANNDTFQYSLDTTNVGNSSWIRTNLDAIGGIANTDNYQSLELNSTGTRIFTSRGANSTFGHSDISAYDISNYSSNYNVAGIAGVNGSAFSLRFSSDGAKVFCGYASAVIREIACSIAFDFANGTETLTTTVTLPVTGNITGLTFNSDGTKLFIANDSTKIILVLDLASPYTLAGYSISDLALFPEQVTSAIQGLYFYQNKLYILQTETIFAYSINI